MDDPNIRGYATLIEGAAPHIMFVTNDGPAPTDIVHTKREWYVDRSADEESAPDTTTFDVRPTTVKTKAPPLDGIDPEHRGCSDAFIAGFLNLEMPSGERPRWYTKERVRGEAARLDFDRNGG